MLRPVSRGSSTRERRLGQASAQPGRRRPPLRAAAGPAFDGAGGRVPTAGLLVSLYALSITISAPLLTALTGRFDRRRLVIWLMAVFLVGNLAGAVAPGFVTLLAARVITAAAHAVFFSVGATVASSLVPRDKAGGAVAVMFGGLTVAMVLGVPLGSWIGETFHWRLPFLIVTALAAASVLSLLAFLPKKIRHTPPSSARACSAHRGPPSRSPWQPRY